MPLGLTVSLWVLGSVVVMGMVGYLIDRSSDAEEPKEDRERDDA